MGLVRGCQPQSENKWESCGQEEILDSDGADSGPTSLQAQLLMILGRTYLEG